jgi:beta-lactamase class A
MKTVFSVVFLLSALSIWPLSAEAPIQKLKDELQRLANLYPKIKIGFAARHLESNQALDIQGEDRFAMASAYKVAIAAEFFQRVDERKDSLERMVTLRVSDLHPGSGLLTATFPKAGIALSMRNLVELMLLDSDNSATDLVLRENGGPEKVTARLKSWGIESFDVSRPTAELIMDLTGVKGLKSGDSFSIEQYETIDENVTATDRLVASNAFYADSRDTATPNAMALLLTKLYKGELLAAESTAALIDMLERCRTGSARLKGILPKETKVAHKTGSFSLVANDVGVMTLPGKAGRVVVVAFTKGPAGPEKERLIAEFSRATHDFFLFHSQQ